MSESREARLWKALFYVVTFASAIPFFVVRYLPFCDLPEHVAAISVLERSLVAPHEVTSYVVAFGSSQYFLYHATGALLMFVTRDAVLANQILIALVAIAWPLSFRSLLRAAGRDERLALFAPMALWSRALLVGFLPFVASLPIAFFAIALVLRQLAAFSLRRAILLAVVATALFYTHVSAYLVFAFIAFACSIVVHLRARVRSFVAIAKVTTPLGPSALCAFAWYLRGSLGQAPAAPADADVGSMGLVRSLKALPVWTFDVWHSNVDRACAVFWWLAVAMLLAFTLRRRSDEPSDALRVRLLAWVPFAAALLVFLATPFRIGPAAMLNVRLAPFVVLLFLLPLDGRGLTRRLARLPFAVAALVSLVTIANASSEIRATSDEVLGDRIDEVLGAMRPGTRVATLAADPSSEHTAFWPYAFMGSYHVTRGGSVASFSFAQMAHWPIHYAPGAEPPPHRAFWLFRPCEYRFEDDGAYFDYVLVSGSLPRFVDGVPGPPFVPVARSGRFTLYEKVAGPPPPPEPSFVGPCRPPPQLAQR